MNSEKKNKVYIYFPPCSYFKPETCFADRSVTPPSSPQDNALRRAGPSFKLFDKQPHRADESRNQFDELRSR